MGYATEVTWSRMVDKQLDRVPDVIARKFRIWVALVEESGIREIRKHRGFHDEPLKGTRHGQRSVRLNRAYRAIYLERESEGIDVIAVLEVNKHEY